LFEGDYMKSASGKFTLALGIILVGTLLTTQAFAACGDQAKSKPGATLSRQSWSPGSGNGTSGSLLPISDNSDDPIVGMWHVTFTAEGNSGGPPDNTPIDNAIVVWHSDRTEIMNSGRPPQDGDFCLGVWKKVDKRKYKVNHFAWGGNDTTDAPSGIGNPQGPTRITEEITLSSDGNHYVGSFTLDATDTSGNPTAHIVGAIAGTRITMDTTVQDLL
jgi:hypothetical protein